VRRIAELLEAEHVEYALIGGYALALQGIVRLTEDVDILVEPSPENARRWVRALSQLPTRNPTPSASTTSSRSTS
jgi:hypothetical protein